MIGGSYTDRLLDAIDTGFPKPRATLDAIPTPTEYPRRLLPWIKHFLPHHSTDPFSNLHRDIAQRMDRITDQRIRKVRDVRQAPRGSAKSTIHFGYALRESLEGRENYITVVGETDDISKEFLETYRSEIEHNPRIAEAYPSVSGRGVVWNKHELGLRNGVLIRSIGAGSKFRGRKHREHRPSLIIIDDPNDKDSVKSPIRRERIYQSITRDIIPAGSNECNVFVIGTPVHPDATVCRLEDQPAWYAKKHQALSKYPERMDLWSEWENILRSGNDEQTIERAQKFYTDRAVLMDVGAELLWPEHETLYDLMLFRLQLGEDSFQAEKNCEAYDPETTEWPRRYFDWPGFYFDHWPQTSIVIKTLFFDPAISEEAKQGDWSAFVLYADEGPGKRAYVQAWMYHDPPEIIAESFCDIVNDHKPDFFGYESNAFQRLYRKYFKDAIRARKMQIHAEPRPSVDNKKVRIRRISGDLSTHRLHFHNDRHTRELVKQLKQFPTGKHDDGPDALEGAIMLANHKRR